jgi:hypothetical protein
MDLASFYYGLVRPNAYVNDAKLCAGVRGHAKNRYALKQEASTTTPPPTLTSSEIRNWLQKQNAYTMNRNVRKRFPRNPYTFINILDVFKCDLIDVQNLAKFNDSLSYIYSAIDVYSKYLHLVLQKSKTGPADAKAFGSILDDPKHSKPYVRRPIIVQTDKGKEFMNKPFQDLLRREGIEHRTCRNPNVKCAVVKLAHRNYTSKKFFKYITHKNTKRYINVLSKFNTAYNATVHSTTGIAPAEVRDSNVLDIWRRIKNKVTNVKFGVGQHIRIIKEKCVSQKRPSRTTAQKYSGSRRLLNDAPDPSTNYKI